MGDEKRKTEGRVERPKSARTPYKYGGSLGWIASMIDPDTSSWKPTRPSDDRTQADRREPEDDESSS